MDQQSDNASARINIPRWRRDELSTRRIAAQLRSRRLRPSDQARELLRSAKPALKDDDYRLACKFVEARPHLTHRLSLALEPAIWRQSRIDDLIMRVLIVLGRY